MRKKTIGQVRKRPNKIVGINRVRVDEMRLERWRSAFERAALERDITWSAWIREALDEHAKR